MASDVQPERPSVEQVWGKPPDDKEGTFVCTLCDPVRVFDTKQGLSMHRSKTHGRPAPGNAARRSREQAKRRRKVDPAAYAAGQKAAGELKVNVTALLKVLYPDGYVPIAKLADVVDWVQEARRLAKD